MLDYQQEVQIKYERHKVITREKKTLSLLHEWLMELTGKQQSWELSSFHSFKLKRLNELGKTVLKSLWVDIYSVPHLWS